jgi:hypothetical protein
VSVQPVRSVGWFGRVTTDTHYLYREYPCLAVYVERVMMDLNFNHREREQRRAHAAWEADEDALNDEEPDIDPEIWNLPDDMPPVEENARRPTENLLG